MKSMVSLAARMLALAWIPVSLASAAPTLEEIWKSPPQESKVRAYWWWLNGNVTKEAITTDLEAMKEKGFGGAVIFDADGAAQFGNGPVPAGPTFGSPEWRDLYKHALREAARLGLTISLNIQSGWNLGGPGVKPEDAAKITVWTETAVRGPVDFHGKLAEPKGKDGFYRDAFVVAWKKETAGAAVPEIVASGALGDHPATLAIDGNPATFWVSDGQKTGDGPTPERPEWLRLDFAKAVSATGLRFTPRPGYGPAAGEIQISDDGRNYRKLADFKADRDTETKVAFPETMARHFRVSIISGFDPKTPVGKSRNVQIAEINLMGPAVFGAGKPAGVSDLKDKALLSTLPGSAPDLRRLLGGEPARTGDAPIAAAEILDLTSKLKPDGSLDWQAPAGDWTVLRFGYTIGPRASVSTSSGGWKGYALDVLDDGAFRRYWQAVVAPLIADAGPLAGKTLKYLHTDSWEIEPINWTTKLPIEFQKRRAYEIYRWLPVFAGQLVESREASDRFLADFRKTLGDLAIDHHYKPFRELAHAAGLEIHPESGGPHVVPIDAQRCLGMDDAPMSEFWATSWKHRVGDPNRFFVKQPASAAHTYGKPLVMAEGFTTVGPHWQERLWNNLKPTFDKALTEGLNSLVWHAWVCSPKETGIPGQQYFAGTHLNPKVTWWSRSKPFFDYINRCQALLQRGLPVADVLYYYGDQVPNYTQLRDADPAGVGHGYDYDVITADALIDRVSVKDGRLVLPEGTSYRLLMLPELRSMPMEVLKKIQALKTAGADIAGPRPESPEGLLDSTEKAAEFGKIVSDLWSGKDAIPAVSKAGEALANLAVKPDFSFTGGSEKAEIRYIHRRDGDAEIYFIGSRGEEPESITASFRVAGKAPEIWDPVSGERRVASAFTEADGVTSVPLSFDPCGSAFVIFRAPGKASARLAEFRQIAELGGPWDVAFDPKWGGPAKTVFPKLTDWSVNGDKGIKYYSGTATYYKSFDLADTSERVWLDLGDVRELAEVRLNGVSLGIVWSPPFRVEMTKALKARGNRLEIDVVNFWPNRVIGDAALPVKDRLTRTNVLELKATTPLMESGLLGPVRVMSRGDGD